MMEQIVQFIMQNTPDVGTSGAQANPFTNGASGVMAQTGTNPFGPSPDAVSSQPLAQVLVACRLSMFSVGQASGITLMELPPSWTNH